MSTVSDCRLIDLPRVAEANGSLTAVHGSQEIPFSIRRVFYVYDVVGGATRGGHAHLELEQFIVAIMGSLTVVLDDASSRRNVVLNRPYQGLYVPRHIWADLVDFSGGAIAVVLASLPYDEREYIRSYDDFVAHRREMVTR